MLRGLSRTAVVGAGLGLLLTAGVVSPCRICPTRSPSSTRTRTRF